MDTLCGIGLPELIIIALVGFVVIGPERSQGVALQAGRMLRIVMTSSWWRDFNHMAQAFRDMPNTLVRMAELEEAQADLNRTIREIEHEVETIDPSRGGMKDSKAVTNPWGIENANAQTIHTPREVSASPPEVAEDDANADQ